MTPRRRAEGGAEPLPADKGAERDASAGAGPESDPEAVRAVLSVFRHIDLPALLGEMLAPVVGWTGAKGAVAVAADEETGGMIPVAWTLPDTHPLLEALRAMVPTVGRHDVARATPTPTLDELTAAVRERGGTLAIPLDPGDGRPVAALLVVEPGREAGAHVDALCALA